MNPIFKCSRPPTPADRGRRQAFGRVMALLGFGASPALSSLTTGAAASHTGNRVRPDAADWPAAADWRQLNAVVGGSLVKVASPFTECRARPDAATCDALFKSNANPWAIGDDVALTQTFGWVGAWTTSPSVYAVAARDAADVAAAVNFARERRVRIVVKGGGHSYQGTSNAPDSLLVWTRRMKDVAMHDAFVPAGCAGHVAPQRAVSCGAGAVWAHLYDAVTTRGGGYVQGGGCTTVGVAGLVQSGGFGSFSKAYGTAAGSLLEVEVVTADGQVRIANSRTNADLFWALKGGGGGNFGVVTRLTLRVHPLPGTFGAVNLTVRAKSDAAFRKLVGLTLDFAAKTLVGPHWGEQLRFRRDNTLQVSMVFQGLSRGEAVAAWQPFFDVIEAGPQEFDLAFSPLRIVATDARTFWAPTLFKRSFGFIKRDDRPGAPESNVFWPGDQGQAGQVLYGAESLWMSAALLRDGRRSSLADALYAASRHWSVSLHLNKGLAGAPAEAIAAARDTPMNPTVLDAFALAILGARGEPAYPGVRGHEPDATQARKQAEHIAACVNELRKVAPDGGSYVSESNYFQHEWAAAFWGTNAARLRAVKAAVDPQGLFFTHHGPGSEVWSDDGFVRAA
ncbi:MAG: FAD-binding oxidoreductase [Caldimonas sp.]